MNYRVVISKTSNEPIAVWECPNCGTTYRVKNVIKRYWSYCPNCGEPIENWEGEDVEESDFCGS